MRKSFKKMWLLESYNLFNICSISTCSSVYLIVLSHFYMWIYYYFPYIYTICVDFIKFLKEWLNLMKWRLLLLISIIDKGTLLL